MASALKREDPKSTVATPPRRCIICCDDRLKPSELMKPCRTCNSDFCIDCLHDMFTAAAYDHGRMPPKCCTLIQIHVVLRFLTDKEANDYREKFEEWLTPKKTYCPAPKCSAFIPERILPHTPPSPQSPASPVSPTSDKPQSGCLKPVILEVLDRVAASHTARFFRGELPITALPGFSRVIQQHMDLGIIRDNVDNYRSMSDVTADMNLIVSNAIDYNGKDHPVTEAAHQLNNLYNIELADAMDRMIRSPKARLPTPARFFPCPKCHIAICTSCRLIEHGNEPCDHSASDEEMAMLQSFGYKRCPRCNAGVKKMYGCSHIQCHCGAHWCYRCQKSTGECDGGCEGDEEDDEEEEDDYDSEDLSDMEEEVEEAPVASADVGRPAVSPPAPRGRVSNATLTIPAAAHTRVPAPAPAQHSHRVVNLDAGGGRRWADSDYDFGDEPEQESMFDVWCCYHNFEHFVVPNPDGFNRGDPDRMECNRCFEKVVAKQRPLAFEPPSLKAAGSKKPRQKLPVMLKDHDVLMKDASPTKKPLEVLEKEAFECTRCRLLLCPDCRHHFLKHS